MTCPPECTCACRTGPYAACDQPGGCGTTHGTVQQKRCTLAEHHCMTAAGLSERCRRLTHADLLALPELWVQLHDRDDIPPCAHEHQRTVRYEEGPDKGKPVLDADGNPVTVPVPCPCAPLASGPLMPGQAGGDKVSGSREAPLGVRVAVLSFIAPPADHRLGLTAAWWDAEDEGLQVGERPLLGTLCAWGRAIVDEHPDRLAGPILSRRLGDPAARIRTLVGWIAARGDWPYEQPWAGEYAAEIRQAVDHARRLLGLYDEEPELMTGVPCPGNKCDYFTLVRYPGEDDIRCSREACKSVLRPAEFEEWRGLYASNPKTARTQWEQAARLRVTAEELDEDPALRRHASQLRAIAGAVEASSDDEWAGQQDRVDYLAGDVAARLRGKKGLPLRHVAGHPVLPAANSADDFAPDELLDFLAARLKEAGDPACYDMPALRAQGWLVRMLAVEYAGHAKYREEWRPVAAPPGWEETA